MRTSSLPRNEEYDTSLILKAIKQPVSQRCMAYLRKSHPEWLEKLAVRWPTGRIEHRFWQQGAGYDRNVINPGTAWKSVEYIHNNPVRRGLVGSPTDWPWSSARWYAGLDDVRLAMDNPPPDQMQC